MAEPAIRPDLLSAYVDGEVSPEEAARISRAAAAEPAIARQIAVLQAMRAQVAAIGAEIAPVPMRMPAPPPPRRLRAGLLSAVLTVVAVAGLALWQADARRPFAGVDQPGLALAGDPDLGPDLDRMIAAYDAWARQAPQALPAEGNPGEDQSADQSGDPRLTRLIEATGLQLVRYSEGALSAGHPASEADYLGPKGCRLSLFEVASAPGAVPDPGLVIAADGSLRIARWTAESRYVLLSRGMDPDRFATIARSLVTATSRPSPKGGADDGDLLAVLSVAHQHCIG